MPELLHELEARLWGRNDLEAVVEVTMSSFAFSNWFCVLSCRSRADKRPYLASASWMIDSDSLSSCG